MAFSARFALKSKENFREKTGALTFIEKLDDAHRNP